MNSDDYNFNHCYVFFGLNEKAFQTIESEFNNFFGQDQLSLLGGMDGIFITDLCGASAGSNGVKEHLHADEVDEEDPDEKLAQQCVADAAKLRGLVDSNFDAYLEHIEESSDSQIGTDCLNLLRVEKNFIVENVRYGLSRWANGDLFQKEDFIGAMVIFVKSSKEFERSDSNSNNQNGMNLPVTSREGFVRTCIYATEDKLSIVYKGESPIEDYEHLGEFSSDYIQGESYVLDGDNPANKYSYNNGTIYGAYSDGAPFGFSYFDQNGALWTINDVSKAITLLHEAVDDETEYFVSH